MERRWVFGPRDRGRASQLARSLQISPITAQVLINRGLTDAAEAKRFFQPELAHLHDPFLFSQMRRATERLGRALRDQEGLAIFGDYDVDGTTGSAILVKYFRLLGREVPVRIPHRIAEGYGLSAAAVEDFARAGVKVLLTVDCGTNDHEEIALARERGMDVIVLDHHETPTRESQAYALLNPKADPAYPFPGLSSVGIAFKLAWAMSGGIGRSRTMGDPFTAFLLDAMSYVALGTVADVSPLGGENRVFVSYGLRALGACRSAGLRALVEKAGMTGRVAETEDISFKLAPRLNALGRVGTAQHTLELLVSEDPVRIAEILQLLESSNRARKDIEGTIVEQAVARIDADPAGLPPVLVVADERWHLGVVGIVAARLVDRYARPAFVLAVDNGLARGSGRSVEGFPLHEALEACRDVIETGGGHARAAGVGLRHERLDEFRARINAFAARRMADGPPEASLPVDEEVRLADVTRGLVRELDRLQPYGEGNRPPLLVCPGVRPAGEPRLMGKKNDHLSFHVADPAGGPGLRVVAFSRAEWFDPIASARTLSLAFRPVLNEWRGTTSVELHAEDIRFGDVSPA